MHTIVLIDDHPMIRRAFNTYLSETGRFLVTGEAGSLDEARALFSTLTPIPDLVLLDIELGEENGLDLLPLLRAMESQNDKKKNRVESFSPMVLVFSMFEDPFKIQTALHQGARGYVSKTADETEIASALESILNGEIYIDKRLKTKATETKDIYAGLSKRERIILDLVQKNMDNRSIAKKLDLKARTVENYISRIYTKTGALTRGDLARL
ncbi:MAG: response regulator transcription factor [Treponema sp.]|jgi:NarL family two-component system response regulator LiaR|nr:response regulator transcription factor [Treponema sp.]